MVKFNVLVIERPTILRSQEDREKEHQIMRKLFDTHKGGMMVRFDLTDSTINKYHDNKILGTGIKDFHNKYTIHNYNYASTDDSYLNLLGVVDTTYVTSDAVKKSKELEKIVDTVETTAALFKHEKEDDESIINTFDTIRKGFVEFNPDANIARSQRDYIVVKGIPEMTIVLCTVTDRKEKDLQILKDHLRKHFVLPSMTELNHIIKNNSHLSNEIKLLKGTSDEIINSKFIEVIETTAKRETVIAEFVKSIGEQKASILQVMHVLNALGKSEIKETPDTAHKRLKDIKNLDDLVKLTCVI